jgi:hypothetical protein
MYCLSTIVVVHVIEAYMKDAQSNLNTISIRQVCAIGLTQDTHPVALDVPHPCYQKQGMHPGPISLRNSSEALPTARIINHCLSFIYIAKSQVDPTPFDSKQLGRGSTDKRSKHRSERLSTRHCPQWRDAVDDGADKSTWRYLLGDYLLRACVPS